jgi:hypothetical protein
MYVCAAIAVVYCVWQQLYLLIIQLFVVRKRRPKSWRAGELESWRARELES